jgi:hypothetical protein
MTEPLLTPEATQMLISSVTQQGRAQLSELEAERLLNAITRAQTGVPTGSGFKQPEVNSR